MFRALIFLAALMFGAPAEAASTINTLPPVVSSPGTYPLPDSGCAATSTQNLWIAQENASPKDDFKIIPEMAGYIHQGNTAPSCPFKYQLWWDTTNNPRALKAYTGSAWVIIGWMDDTNGAWIPPASSGVIAAISSSTTTDLCQGGSTPGGTIFVSGNATITSFGTSCPVGTIKNVVWTGAATVQTGSGINVAGGVTKTVNPGDVWQLSYMSVGTWKQFYQQPGQSTVGFVSNVAVDLLGGGPGITITADTVHVGQSLAGPATVLANFNQQILIGNGGAGGMDTGAGTQPANNFVAVYAIAGSAGVAVLGYTCNVSCPTVYPGSNMPAGYTSSALLVVWPTTAGKQFYNGHWRGKSFRYGGTGPAPVLDHSASPATLPTALTLLGQVPLNAVSVQGQLSLTITTYGGGYPFITVFPQGSNTNAPNILQGYTASAASLSPPGVLAGNFDTMIAYGGVPPGTLPAIFYQTSADISATMTATIAVRGYTIP